MAGKIFCVGDVVLIQDVFLHRHWKEDPIRGEIVESGVRECKVRLGQDLPLRVPDLPSLCVWIRRSKLVKDRWPSLRDRADFLFGRTGYRGPQELAFPWSGQNACMHAAHDGFTRTLASRRILINVQGLAMEFDACRAHEDMDGSCLEHVPLGDAWRETAA